MKNKPEVNNVYSSLPTKINKSEKLLRLAI